jgi:DnaJ-class molecular chaperone
LEIYFLIRQRQTRRESMNAIQDAIIKLSEKYIDQTICKACEGSGQYIPPYTDGTYICDVYLICQECSGTGKASPAAVFSDK